MKLARRAGLTSKWSPPFATPTGDDVLWRVVDLTSCKYCRCRLYFFHFIVKKDINHLLVTIAAQIVIRRRRQCIDWDVNAWSGFKNGCWTDDVTQLYQIWWRHSWTTLLSKDFYEWQLTLSTITAWYDHYLCLYRDNTPCLKKTVQTYFLSELCQISTNCGNFWQKDNKENKLFWGLLICHLT